MSEADSESELGGHSSSEVSDCDFYGLIDMAYDRAWARGEDPDILFHSTLTFGCATGAARQHGLGRHKTLWQHWQRPRTSERLSADKEEACDESESQDSQDSELLLQPCGKKRRVLDMLDMSSSEGACSQDDKAAEMGTALVNGSDVDSMVRCAIFPPASEASPEPTAHPEIPSSLASKSSKSRGRSPSQSRSPPTPRSETAPSTPPLEEQGTRRADVGVTVGPLAAPLPLQPAGTPADIQWWFRTVWCVWAGLRIKMPSAATLEYRAEFLCAGSGTDLEALKVLPCLSPSLNNLESFSSVSSCL